MEKQTEGIDEVHCLVIALLGTFHPVHPVSIPSCPDLPLHGYA
jgi:hypothetical protein